MFTINHWFHRNPLKSTALVSFDQRTSPSSTDAMQICHQLRQLRLDILQLLCNPTLETSHIRDSFDKYISLLTGYVESPDGSSDDSKLRYTTKFYWIQQQAASFCEQYSKTKGAGSPQRHPFFLQLDSMIRRVQSTVEFENNIIHHKRAATDLQPLENPVHGILPAEEYIPAKLNSLFSANTYRAFDIGRNVGKQYKEDKHAREVKEAREMPIPQGMPPSESACIIA
ncbi:unnamed protein product [Rotaria socialis]|uniref:BRO1 domain-containing protein n=1 Tax=Rotaria socialis TaxID=392032 RepID=A0A821MQ34_9BILA|nr:unnamed protein product [Rotaria socialis]